MGRSTIKNNLIFQMLYEVLVIILPIVTSPYISRTIGAQGLGQYSYTYSVATFFVLFSMLGLKNYGSRVIAQTRNDEKELNETFSSLLILHIKVSVLCFIVYILYALTVHTDQLLVWIQSAYVLSALFDISWLYFGLEKFKLTALQSAVVKILTAICIFVFIKGPNDIWKYCAIMAGGMLFGQIVLWVPLRKYVSFSPPASEDTKKHIKPLLVLFVPAIAISLYKYMDKIMLGAISSKMQLGFYENAEKITNVPLCLITAVGTVMLPRMSNLIKNTDKESVSRYISASMRYMMCLAFAFTFGMAGSGQVFAPVFWGKEFLPSGILIVYLSTTIPFLAFANVIRTQYLIPTEKDHEYLISVIAGAVVNLTANWVLIPYLGATGATVGTIAAEITVCCIQTFYVRNVLSLRIYIKEFIPFFLLGWLMFTVMSLIGRNGSTFPVLLLQIGVGGTLYAVGCCIILFCKRDELILRMLKTCLSKYRRSDSH